MRHFVIGDIHGNAIALESIIDAIKPTQTDRITFLGDVIDHGPESREVLDKLIALRQVCQTDFIEGNHEAMLLASITDADARKYWVRYGGDQTLKSFHAETPNEIPKQYIQFIRGFSTFVETERFLFVHAGVLNEVPVKGQAIQTLQWDHMTAPAKHSSGKVVVHGHTPSESVRMAPHCIAMDTGIARGGLLSCLELHSHQLVQADQKGSLRTPRVDIAA